ncbi:MAG TPA: DNA-formamidopyrimidine glycosylase family protein [Labilithrix sp.]|jgi:formamidopyrimidine-DNA glycosylase
MPELPEVEVVRRSLVALRGAKIARVECADPRIGRIEIDAVGSRVREVGRRGKWLRLALDRGVVFSHLGMTGDWTLTSPDAPPLRFERARLDAGAASARYTDPRRFGRFVVAPEDIDAWRELGPDPLLDGIDEARLLAILKKRRRTVKEVLMDQAVLAGVGNILAIEALWRAAVDPRTPSHRMTPRDVRAIARELRRVIRATIAHDERVLAGKRSRAPFRVYGRAGEPCPRCAATLRAVVLGGRTTTLCLRCQRPHAS